MAIVLLPIESATFKRGGGVTAQNVAGASSGILVTRILVPRLVVSGLLVFGLLVSRLVVFRRNV
jgi:hypothetical protein